MDEKLITTMTGLPAWMQYSILVMFVLSIVFPIIFKAYQDNKMTNKLVDNEKKLGTLLDLLYARFSNNLSVDVAKEIITLTYVRTRYSIRDKIIELLKNYNNDKEDTEKYKFKYDLLEFINNKYYEDSMFLGKLSCKSIKLNFYHTEFIKPDNISDDINNYLNHINFKLTCNITSSSCKDLEQYLSTLFQTLTNKTNLQLENIITKINSDYGN
jgi:hypothetical protein